MATLTRRMQILLDESQYRRLEEEADRSGRSMGALIRDALDRAYGHSADARRAAVTSFLAAPPVPVGDWDEEKRLIRDRFTDA